MSPKRRKTVKKAKPKARRVKEAAPALKPVPSATRPESVKLAEAKGRPMLTWVGKRPLRQVTAFPAQYVEKYGDLGFQGNPAGWPDTHPRGGLALYGDNKEVLANLLANGFRKKVALIYIDPPFNSGADYVRRVSLRGRKRREELEAEGYSLGEQFQYTDIWANDNYLQFMFERLLLLKELLRDGGAIFLHCDSTKGHHLRFLLDEVFGPESFVNEIIWSYRRWPSNTDAFQSMHDTILYYVVENTDRRTFHRQYEGASESYLKRFGGKTQVLDEETRTRKITSSEDTKGMPLRDVWDISILAGFKGERTDYPTQKPEELVERIVGVCSNPGDIILDCFVGSGTTAAVAQKLGRRWIACDINKGAIQTTAKRLQTIITDQIAERGKHAATPELGLGDAPADAPPPPAQLGFTVWRVNDYDLEIQHNEAVNLVAEHLGLQRTRTDVFFDGTLGKSLVKIIPFTHPLSPTDLDELRRELDARPEEDRPVSVVCLGIELAARKWVDDWNALRKGKQAVNRIEVIELRTDPKYGGFLKHESATARVRVLRTKGGIKVEIDDFISPTVIERLRQQAGILNPKIDDWRAMVDAVMIDPAYDGKVFNVKLADVPRRKQDLVEGRYELPAGEGKGKTTVAVKITDVLGEEVLVTREV